jgi:hypothetical protein
MTNICISSVTEKFEDVSRVYIDMNDVALVLETELVIKLFFR